MDGTRRTERPKRQGLEEGENQWRRPQRHAGGRHIEDEEDGEGGTADHENAAKLQAAVNDATAAAAATPAPPTPNLAEQELEKRRQEIWDLAQDQGAEITCEAIARMASEELEEWASAYLL